MVVRLMISRLRPGVSRNELLALARSQRGWLKAQPGFVSYELYTDEATWVDRVVWRSMGEAEAAGRAFAQTEMAWELGELVQPEQQAFLGRRIEE